jgi:Big-like domain-containing protein
VNSSNVGIVEIIKNTSNPIQSSSPSPSSLSPISTDESTSTSTETKETIMNTPPTGQNQDVETSIGTPIDINSEAIDPNEGDDLTATIAVPPLYGNLSEINQQTGVVTYTPRKGYEGQDRFSFNVNDGIEDSVNDADDQGGLKKERNLFIDNKSD